VSLFGAVLAPLAMVENVAVATAPAPAISMLRRDVEEIFLLVCELIVFSLRRSCGNYTAKSGVSV